MTGFMRGTQIGDLWFPPRAPEGESEVPDNVVTYLGEPVTYLTENVTYTE